MEQVKKPGVEITQVVSGTTPAVSSPSLIPCVIGPAFEVVDLLNADSTLNADAELKNSQGNSVPYTQVPISISTQDFPTIHVQDKDQMQVLQDEVQVALFSSGEINQLDVRPSSAFLAFANKATRAGLFFYPNDNPANFNLKMNIAIDQRNVLDVTSDFRVNIAASSLDSLITKLATELSGHATVTKQTYTVGGVQKTGVLIQSNRYGAASSITLRKISNGVQAVHDVPWGLNNSLSYRVTGAGFTAFDSGISATSAYVTWSVETAVKGSSLTDTSALSDSRLLPKWANEDGTILSSPQSQITFGNTGDIPIKAATPISDGDLFYTTSGGFGANVSGIQIIQVESTRFKLGRVDTARSVYDASGNPTNQKYIEYPLNILSASSPFAPKNAFFVAKNITEENTDSTFASVSGEITDASYQEATPASIVLEFASFPLSGSTGTSLSITSIVNDGTPSTYSITVDQDFADEETLVASFQAQLDAQSSNIVVSSNNANEITLESSSSGKGQELSVTGNFLSSTTSTDTVLTAVGSDSTVDGLQGETLSLNFNGSVKDISINAITSSIEDFVGNVNETIGYVVCSFDSANAVIEFASYLKGVGGSIIVRKSTLAALLGFSSSVDTSSTGTGRPNPDLLVNSDGSIKIGAEILRNPLNGKPTQGIANIYIAYRALRLDLTAIANQPGLIKVSSLADINSVYGPISTRNPLGLGMYFTLLNAGDGVEISALGVSDVSSVEPNGTALSYIEAIEFLRSYEVYAIAPLSSSEQVIEAIDKHVKELSDPLLRAERVVITAPVNPIRRNPRVVLSGSNSQSTGNLDQIDLNSTPEAVLGSEGVDTSSSIPFQLSDGRQLFVTMSFGDDVRNYSVKEVDGSRITINRSLSNSQNADGFYSTESLPSEFSSVSFSLQLRGTLLTILGSNKLDKTAYAQTVRDKAQQYANRRQLRLYPDTVQAVLGGVNVALPSFYYACAIAGACSSVAPQEPFTRRKLLGFVDVIGPALESTQYDIISAGNSVIEVESSGEVPALRIQATTDVSSIESREWSVTRAVDYFAKTIRNALRRRIGSFNITQAYIDDLSTLLDSACTSASDAGLFKSASVTKLEQDKSQPDSLLCEIKVEVLYPANYIKIKIVI